jgi:DNA-binding beta-propeller fold protein YncE
LFPLLGAFVACGSSNDEPPQAPPPAVDAGEDAAESIDPLDFAKAPLSCAYSCPVASTCAETQSPYVCPSAGDWKSIPHEDACGTWDGTYPAVTPGSCTAAGASGEAAKYAGPDLDHPGTIILPDGRRMSPAGQDWVFDESDLSGGLTTLVARVPGTSLVLTVDSGPIDHAVRAIDTAKIGGASTPVTGYVKFALPSTLNSAIAFVAPGEVFVATDDGNVQAMTLDTTTGALTRDDAKSIKLPPSVDPFGKPANWYVGGLAASPDGKRLVVTGVAEHELLIYDVDAASATYGAQVGSVDLGVGETFGAWFDPNDVAGTRVYVSIWGGKSVLDVDVSNPAQPAVMHTYKTDKDPEGLAFIDARYMAVAADLGDSIAIIDRANGAVSTVQVGGANALHGMEPSAVAYDPAAHRLYVTLSGANAIAAYDIDVATTPPTVTPAGELPTAWWPSGIALLDDGSLVVANMRGHGTGPRPLYFDLGDSDIDARMRGSIEHIAAPSAADLTTGSAVVAANDAPSELAGAPTVTCPTNANDFPVPSTNTNGPSSIIKHVFLIVRENKGFDGVFGDLPGVNGEPSYTLKTQPGEMDDIWKNLRALARTFAISDNYYTDAIYSTQGHVWATYGRTNDFNERTWAISGSRRSARAIPGGGVIDVGQPVEGSLFDWLGNNNVEYDILGEIVGSPQQASATHPPIDGKYPGGPFQNIGHVDLEKACHAAGRARVLCNFGSFVYMTLPNDHTFGLSPTNPTPETFCTVNDEATGMFIDALTHSPLWKDSAVFITEDDPSQGGEHVDSHRTPLVVISPWAKRGYVSKTHIDMASLHKLFAHILGIPYNHAIVANASLPLDLFTSTPDYTPYSYSARTRALACGDTTTMAEIGLTLSWDMSDVDEQPGLDAQVTRWMRGVQYDKLPIEIEREIYARTSRDDHRE